MNNYTKEQAEAFGVHQQSTLPVDGRDVKGRDVSYYMPTPSWQGAPPPQRPHGIEIIVTSPSPLASVPKRKRQASPPRGAQFLQQTPAAAGTNFNTTEHKSKRSKPAPRAGFLHKLPDLSYTMPPGPALNFTVVEIVAILSNWFKHQFMATRLLNNSINSGTHFAILEAHRDIGQDVDEPHKTKDGIADLYRKAMRKINPQWTKQSHKAPEDWNANNIAVNAFRPDAARVSGYNMAPSIVFKDLMIGLTKLPQGNDAGDLTRALQFASRTQKIGPNGEAEEFLFPDDIHVILNKTGYVQLTQEHTDGNILGRYQAIVRQADAAQRVIDNERKRRARRADTAGKYIQPYTPQGQALQPTMPRQLPPGVVNFPHLEGWATRRSEAVPQPQPRYDPSAMVPYVSMAGGHFIAPMDGLHPVFVAQETYRHPSAVWPSYSPSADLYAILRKEGVLTPSQHGTVASSVAGAPILTAAGAGPSEFQLPLRSTPTPLPEEPVPANATAESTAIQLAATRTPPLSDGTADIQSDAQDVQSAAEIPQAPLGLYQDTPDVEPFSDEYFAAKFRDAGMDAIIASHQDFSYSDMMDAFNSELNSYAMPEDEVVAMVPPNNKTKYLSTQLLRDCVEADDLNDGSDLAVAARYAREPHNLASAFTVGHVDHVLGLVNGDGWNGDS